MSFTTLQSSSPVCFGRGGYNKNGGHDDEVMRNQGRGGYNKNGGDDGSMRNYGRGGYNKGPDDDEPEDGRGGYN